MTAGTAYCVITEVPPSPGSRRSESRGTEPLLHRVRIRDVAGEIRPVRARIKRNAADVSSALCDVNGHSRLHRHDARQFPSTQRRLEEPVIAVLEERQLVIEV